VLGRIKLVQIGRAATIRSSNSPKALQSRQTHHKMPGQPLPTIPSAEIANHGTAKSCYVTVGNKVYDVTDFLSDHPGGADLILEHIRDEGHDVEAIMQDEVSHTHTEAAYEILEEHLIGFVAKEDVMNGAVKSSEPDEILPLPASKEGEAELRRVNGTVNGTANGYANGSANGSANGAVKKPLYEATGMSSEEDLNKETDLNEDFKTHHFLDLNKPLLMQVWFGKFDKKFYLEQVHRPRHYRGGASAPLFGNFLEPLSLTPWWVVPTVWLPCVAYGSYLASQGMQPLQQAGCFAFGLFLWTLVEYVLHRFLFHLD
jgi:4-hydroxysphinganine ceramide fatty acyl 2-hydroxylase